MTTPTVWNQLVPREVEANLAFRADILKRANSSRSTQLELIHACKNDFLFYINVFGWQFNPNHFGAEDGPFITWDFQETASQKIIDHISQQRDLRIEKSREMGASWLCLWVMDWYVKFHRNKKFLLVSRSEDAVDDKNDPDSLFWKLDFITRHQPEWLLPEIKRTTMSIATSTGSYITGQASTGKAGVGGRATAMFIDEFSQIREAYAILSQTADTTRCRIFNYTHIGPGNAAYEISQRPDMDALQMHWSQHPEKNKGLYKWDIGRQRVHILNSGDYDFGHDYHFVKSGKPNGGPFPGLRSPWYDAEVIRRASERSVAINLDINPQGATSQFFDAGTIADLIRTYAEEPRWKGDLDYDVGTARPSGLVKRENGRVHLWFQPMLSGFPPEARYVVGVDNGAGTGATPSCLSIVNVDLGEKWVEIADPHMSAEDFASLVVAMCQLFRDKDGKSARLCWENKGPGVVFGKAVQRLGYMHVYWRKDETSWTRKNFGGHAGWDPTPKTKLQLLEDYRLALSRRKFINRSEMALKECLDFAYDNRAGENVVNKSSIGGEDPSGAGVNHGDRVVSDALAWKMCMEAGSSLQEGKEEVKEAPIGSLGWRQQLWEQHADAEMAKDWG